MMNRIKALPTTAVVLFALVLAIEITTFILTRKMGAIARMILLSALMFMTIGGVRAARYILVFLLFGGALFLALASLKAQLTLLLQLAFFYFPALLLGGTATYIMVSKDLKAVIEGKYASAKAEPFS